MDETDYYYAYICLKFLVERKKITRNVAQKILNKYEDETDPIFKHCFIEGKYQK